MGDSFKPGFHLMLNGFEAQKPNGNRFYSCGQKVGARKPSFGTKSVLLAFFQDGVISPK
jgi:hypothetical protein